MSRTRVVITGLGVVSPLGIGHEAMWANAVAGNSAAGPITLFDASAFDVTVACEVPNFVAADFMPHKVARRMDRYAQMAVAAARLALDDAGLAVDRDGQGIGAVIGNGGSGTISREQQHRIMQERGIDRISPFSIPLSVANMGAGQVSIELGLRGPVTAVCTACASGTDSIGTAADIVRRGDARAMLAGGADCLISPYFLAGFDAMRVLPHGSNDQPTRAARPFNTDRAGFLIGEGGVVAVLEPLEAARARGARIICEVAGYGSSNDAHHITDPDTTGNGQTRAMVAALADGGIAPEQVGHVNTHGGGSRPGDPTEIASIRAALGDHAAAVLVNATKSMHGHCMGATGALEAAITALSVHHGLVPPTINLVDLDPECAGVDHVIDTARAADLSVALSNGFGLGGHNAVLALARVDD